MKAGGARSDDFTVSKAVFDAFELKLRADQPVSPPESRRRWYPCANPPLNVAGRYITIRLVPDGLETKWTRARMK
jgi:hypothetical protein